MRSAAPAVITIALADHHRLIRESVRFLLETENDVKVVGEVADGLKVVGLVERRKPRVLIMALVMPGLNSFEVTRRVRQRSPETAVILLSMHAGDQYVVEALRSGASGCVGTQAKGIELIRAVREVAAGGRYLSAPLSEHRMDTWLQRAKSRALDPYDALTRREREVFNLVSEGYSSANIASRLSISRRTAESHRANVMRKLQLGNRSDLIRFAIARGILALPPDPLSPLDEDPGPGGRRRAEYAVSFQSRYSVVIRMDAPYPRVDMSACALQRREVRSGGKPHGTGPFRALCPPGAGERV